MNTKINKETSRKEEITKSKSITKNLAQNSFEADFELNLLDGTEAYYSERYGWTLRRTK